MNEEIKEWQTQSVKHKVAYVLMMDGISFRYTEACYRALKTVLSVGSHEEAKLFIENKISSLTDSLLSGSIRRNSTSAASNLAHTLELEMKQSVREKFIMLLEVIEKGESVEG